MKTMYPYLTFHGNCEAAFEFYKKVFGGEFSTLRRFSEIPPDLGEEMPENEKKKIMFVSLRLNNTTVLLGSDAGGEWGKDLNTGNNISLSVTTESRDEADKFFDELSKGGEVKMPIGDAFWGSYYGMCKDKYGINWMISYGEEETNN
ncbi:MAG: VOC family protein [Salinimicrobium sp.]